MRLQLNHRPTFTNLFLLALLMLVSSSPAFSATIADLQAQKTLTIETWLSTQNSSNRVITNEPVTNSNSINKTEKPAPLTVAIGEQLTLNIEVGTNRWFTRGTTIANVELPNVMSKQREQFAINSTKRINGETWSFQLWQISLIAQGSGRYEVPALGLNIEVMTADDGKIPGKIISQKQIFEANLPDASLLENNWFSSPKVNVKQQWQQSNSILYVGDSVTRTVTISAADTLSVLLPTYLTQTKNSKFQAYDDPVALQDTEQRGEYLSSRTEKQTYIIQQGGELVFPDVVFRWWDTKNQQVKEKVLKGQTVMIKHTLASWLTHYRHYLWVATFMLISFIGLMMGLIKYYQQRPAPLWWQYVQAKSLSEIRRLLYKRVRQNNGQLTLSKGINHQQQQCAIDLQQGNIGKLQTRFTWKLWFSVKTKNQNNQRNFLSSLRARLFPSALPNLAQELEKREGKNSADNSS